MNKRKPLTKEQKAELLEAMKSSKITREYRYLQAIYLYSSGTEVGEIMAKKTWKADKSNT